MKHIGVISALRSEMEHILAAMTDVTKKNYVNTPFYTGKVGEITVTITECGIGPINAAIHTQVLVDHYPVEAIICTGVAGSLSEKAGHLSLVISEKMAFHDMDARWLTMGYPGKIEFVADPVLVRLAEECAEAETVIGTIVTGNTFVEDAAMKHDLHSRFGALAVEMEGAAIAHGAYVNNLPFVVLRSISDMADGKAQGTFQDFEKLAAKIASDTVLRMLEKMQ